MPPYDLLLKMSHAKDLDEYLQYINTSLVDSKPNNNRKPSPLIESYGD